MIIRKLKTSKIKIAVVIGLLCCMAFSMSVMAFNQNYSYAVAPNETKTIASFIPGASTIYISIRQNTGEVIIYLNGVVYDSTTFPDDTSGEAWIVTVPNPSATVTIKARAGSRGATGILHIWS